MMFYETFEVCRGGAVHYGFAPDSWSKDLSLSPGLDCDPALIISATTRALPSPRASLSSGAKQEV